MTPAPATGTTARALPAASGRPPDETTTVEENSAPARFIPVVRGTAHLGYVPPDTKVENGMVVSRLEVKNLSPKAIAGLKVEEFWHDKAGNLSAGSVERLREPLAPGATAMLTLRTPRNPRMFQNQYRFRHAYGDVKVEQLPKNEKID